MTNVKKYIEENLSKTIREIREDFRENPFFGFSFCYLLGNG